MENAGPNAWKHPAAGFAAALIAAALCAAAWSGSASAAYPGENGRIAYSVDGDIRTAAADGSDDTVLADESPTPPGAATSPFYSDDGTRIAYASYDRIVVRDAGGGGTPVVITPPPPFISPSIFTIFRFDPPSVALSPDGMRVAYVLHSLTNIFPAVTSIQMTVVVSPVLDGPAAPPSTAGPSLYVAAGVDPAFTPDGASIVYARGDFYGNGPYDIYLASSTVSGDGTPVVSGAEDERGPDVSPDGSSIVYQTDVGGNYDVWTAPLAMGSSTGTARVTAPDQDLSPVFSPDGEQIAFRRASAGVVVAPAAGPLGTPATVVAQPNAAEPSWGEFVPPPPPPPPPDPDSGDQTPVSPVSPSGDAPAAAKKCKAAKKPRKSAAAKKRGSCKKRKRR